MAETKTATRPRLAAPLVLSILLGLLATCLTPAAAQAEAPSAVRDPVSDHVGVVAGSEGDIERAFSQVTINHGVRMFVVYVATFDNMSARAWADETFHRSSLGPTDFLLAVAMTDREFAYVVDRDFELSDEDLEGVPVAAQRNLADDPAGAAIAVANALDRALERGASQGGGVPGWLMVAGFAVVAVALVLGQGLLRLRRGLSFFPASHGWNSGTDTGWDAGSRDSSSGTRGGSGSF